MDVGLSDNCTRGAVPSGVLIATSVLFVCVRTMRQHVNLNVSELVA